MKRFKFRLQRVLEYRNSIKKEKERELALRNAELHAAEDRLKQIVEMQDSVPLVGDEMSMAELILRGDYLRYLQESLIMQRLLVHEAAEAVDEAREAYVEKAVEAESLESLKKKKLNEYKEERKRVEKKELNELTIQRHRFKATDAE
jgi:flagellar FliJ protein